MNMIKTTKLNRRNGRVKIKQLTKPAVIKLDIGCGSNKKPGFIGCDQIAFPGVDVVTDLNAKWPWKDSSVEEAHCSHCLEHFDAMQRVHFFNELYRVMIPSGKCMMITPHWCSCRAYGDPTHKWPPVSEFLWYYLKRDWRLSQAPHTDSQHNPNGFNCNFEVSWGYAYEAGVAARNQEYIQMAQQYYKEACTDMLASLTCTK